MNVSLFSQSLFALPLYDAISATAMAGFHAIELACTAPHFELNVALLRSAAHLARNNAYSFSPAPASEIPRRPSKTSST